MRKIKRKRGVLISIERKEVDRVPQLCHSDSNERHEDKS